MRSLAARAFAAVLAVLTILLTAGSTAKNTSITQPDKLVILSTNDVKGKTSPCG